MFYVSQIEYTTDPEKAEQKFVRGMTTGLRNGARHWKLNFAPDHFKPSAVAKYDYQLRTKEYQIRKARKMKHQNPLVWTGTLRQMVLAQFPNPRITDSGGVLKSQISLDVPEYTFYTRTKSGSAMPKKYDELIRMSGVETDILRGILMADIAVAVQGRSRKVVKTG